jgi:pimeloyl-ACP methyl ester carboxylesterase
VSAATSRVGQRHLILVHGSWMGGWSWDAVTPFLVERGAVHAPTLAGPGLADHVAQIVALIDSLAPDPAVLIGHSYGALVASEAAALRPQRIEGLVILDGFIADAGQSAFTQHPEIETLLLSLVDPERPGLVQPAPVASLLAPGESLPEGTEARLTAMSLATHNDVAFHSTADLHCPIAYVACAQFAPLTPVHARARQLGWDVHAIDAGHLAILTHPADVAKAVAQTIDRME